MSIEIDSELITNLIVTHRELAPPPTAERVLATVGDYIRDNGRQSGLAAVTALSIAGGIVGEALPAAAATPPGAVTVTIHPGDTVSRFATQVPGETPQQAEAGIIQLNDLSDPNLIRAGQTLLLPAGNTPNTAPEATPAPTTHPVVIEAGQTVAALGRQYDFSVTEFAEDNPGVDPNLVYAGKAYNFPNSSPNPPAEPAPLTEGSTPSAPVTVTVPVDGTVWNYAEQAAAKTGSTVSSEVQAINSQNGITNDKTEVHPGQQLIVPAEVTPEAEAPTPPPVVAVAPAPATSTTEAAPAVTAPVSTPAAVTPNPAAVTSPAEAVPVTSPTPATTPPAPVATTPAPTESAPTAPTPPPQPESMPMQVASYLGSKYGFSSGGIAGVLGNMQAESGDQPERLQNTPSGVVTPAASLTPDQLNDPYLGWGIVQEDPPEKFIGPTLAAGKDPDSLTVQLDFMVSQMSPDLLADLRNPNITPENAAFLVEKLFERPQTDSDAPTREAFARAMFNTLAASTVTATQPVTPAAAPTNP